MPIGIYNRKTSNWFSTEKHRNAAIKSISIAHNCNIGKTSANRKHEVENNENGVIDKCNNFLFGGSNEIRSL